MMIISIFQLTTVESKLDPDIFPLSFTFEQCLAIMDFKVINQALNVIAEASIPNKRNR